MPRNTRQIEYASEQWPVNRLKVDVINEYAASDVVAWKWEKS